MKIEAPQENKIVVELTDEDMTDLDITYEKMDYSNIETRRVIWTLLDRARRTLGRDIDPSGKMLIEALPKPTGGCVIYFTVLDDDVRHAQHRSSLRIQKELPVAEYEFESLDSLVNCAMAVACCADGVPESSLYESDGRYRLLVKSEAPSKGLRRIFAEYGTKCTGACLHAEFTREHWKLLAKSDAIEKLSI